ncbi:MAG: nitroreductase family protein [Candidatus Amulumruptor caecigallinarius]|nr:nitroreductase family protein [Candidatus Amulumruptor caecigallinarius]MCM1395915.1 nitroreductase family protein [Candidatus Amulumruptor caecigallinarius]MCM1452950.1 nitroreductase family protein [bacterium]
MNTSRLLNILLAVTLVVLSVRLVKDDGRPQVDAVTESPEAIIMDNILSRTSIRDYQAKPVEDAKIEQMLRAAMAAPTAGNKQPWRFIVIKNRATLDSIATNFRNIQMAAKAPLAIVVCGDLSVTFPGEGIEYWVQDASAATENLLLEAHALGLGAVWCGIYPISERVTTLKQMLDIPDGIVPLNVIPIGYPAESPAPKDKWKPEQIHYEKWTDTAAK